MKRPRLKDQLRRRWSKWKRPLGACLFFIVISVMVYAGIIFTGDIRAMLTRSTPAAVMTMGNVQEETSNQAEGLKSEQVQFLQTIRASAISRKTHLFTSYVCGTETTSLGLLSAEHLAEMLEQHPDWHGRLNSKGEVWLEREVEDLSAQCKQQAYMGVSIDGQLTLFEGSPKKEKVIRTFFQLDIGSMESALPEGVYEQLKQGIRIQDMNEYNSILSTFSDFAVERTQKVLNQHY